MTTAAIAVAQPPLPPPSSLPLTHHRYPKLLSLTTPHRRATQIHCSVSLKPDPSSTSSTLSPEDEAEQQEKLLKIGSKVKLTAPLKLHHVAKAPGIELEEGSEGTVKQYVGFWKGKRISANYPYKVEFVREVPSKGIVKFVAHLRDDEFEFI